MVSLASNSNLGWPQILRHPLTPAFQVLGLQEVATSYRTDIVILRTQLNHSDQTPPAKATSLGLTTSGLRATAGSLDSDRQREDIGWGGEVKFWS